MELLGLISLLNSKGVNKIRMCADDSKGYLFGGWIMNKRENSTPINLLWYKKIRGTVLRAVIEGGGGSKLIDKNGN